MSEEMKNGTIARNESFWGLLGKEGSNYSIYIPRIQRDYAQGREDPATNQIRDRFVDDLLDSIVNYLEGKTLDINFIYGNIEQEDETKRFIPIDGQQRLTTLFLLHWYFALFSGQIDANPEVQKRLLQFQYETRNVTGKFCKNLTEYVRVDLKTLPTTQKVSGIIKNYYWFFTDFENDSSIKSMLIMIDTIHEKVRAFMDKGLSLDHVFDLLTSDKSPIRFLYLNIDDVGLTDSIYIKMNARGKPLTHFENFKAQLRAYLSSDEEFAEDFIRSINGQWSEFFWTPKYRAKIRDSRNNTEKLGTTFDSQMMKFFRFMMLMDYITQLDDELAKNNQINVRITMPKLLEEQDYIFTARLFKDGFSSVYKLQSNKKVLSIETFKKIRKLLNVLANRQRQTGTIVFVNQEEYGKEYIDETKAFCRLIGVSEERALTNEEQIVLFAEYAFLIKYANKDDTFDKEIELTRWLRLVYNLIKPTLNLQLDIFMGMIRSVNTLVENGCALECDRYMRGLLKKNYYKSELSVFTESQVVEESIKSILMNIHSTWKTAVADSENTFMEGQTGALLAFSGLTNLYTSQITAYEMAHPENERLTDDSGTLAEADIESSYYKRFIDYLDKFKMLFDQDGVKPDVEKEALFRRALLCYGGKNSYMLPPNKAIQSFLDNTDRDYSFKRLLRDDNSGKRNFLKELMDDLDTTQPVCEQLQKIIDDKTFTEEERWKQLFVKNPEILSCTHRSIEAKRDPQGEWVFMSMQRFIRRNNNDDILLLTRTQTNSVNRELYSYVLFLNVRRKKLNIHYHAESTDAAEKYAYYTNQQDEQVDIVYKKKTDAGYVYIAERNDKTELFCHESAEAMIDYVEKTIKQ